MLFVRDPQLTPVMGEGRVSNRRGFPSVSIEIRLEKWTGKTRKEEKN